MAIVTRLEFVRGLRLPVGEEQIGALLQAHAGYAFTVDDLLEELVGPPARAWPSPVDDPGAFILAVLRLAAIQTELIRALDALQRAGRVEARLLTVHKTPVVYFAAASPTGDRDVVP